MNGIQRRLSYVCGMTIGASLVFANLVNAQGSLDAQRQALGMISDTADRICGKISLDGHNSSSEVKGNVNAELKGLAAKLTGAGISGTGKITSSDYSNVLQSDLSNSIRSSSDCKERIFNSLKAIVLPGREGGSGATSPAGGNSIGEQSTPPSDIKNVLGKWCDGFYIFELSWDGKRYWFQRSFSRGMQNIAGFSDSAQRTQIYYSRDKQLLYFTAGKTEFVLVGRVYLKKPDEDSLTLSFSEDGWYTKDGREIRLQAC